MTTSVHGAKTLQAAFAAAIGFFLLLGVTDAGIQHTNLPTNPTEVPQETAEPPLRVPATTHCTETVLVHTFANSYGSPGYGQHTAATCPGPWSFIGLTVDVSTSGVQFDRLFDIYVGHVPLLSSSTSEPASEIPNAVTYWEVNSDVSRFAGLLGTDQPITAILDNVMDSTDTGEYAVTLTLTFYATDANDPAIVAPNYVGAVFDPGSSPYQSGPGDYDTSGYASLGPNTTSNPTASRYSKSVTLPTNLVSLVADVYAEGHGACEEFWWAEPGQCGVGTPVRQAVLSIDGVIAGFAPVYPTIFTGGGGPGNWEPIPSPRAWHLDPYQMDLSPFVGLLVDGNPHTFTIDIPDAAYSDPGDYWVVGATLLGVTDPVLSQTSGALTSAPVATSATETDMMDPTDTATLDFTATRSGSWTGYVVGSAGTTTTVVTNTFTMSSMSAEEVLSTWNWNYSSQVTVGAAAPVTSTYAKTYTLDGSALGGGTFGDSGTYSIDGPKPYNSSFSLQLVTAGAVEANLTEAETYDGSDSTGYCYQRVVNAAGGYVVSDQTSPVCLTVPAVTTGGTSGGTTGGSTAGGTSSGTTSGGSSSGGTTGGASSGGASSGGTTGGASSGGSSTGGSSGGTTTGGSTALYAPSAALSVTPASGTTPLMVTFSGAASTTPNAGATISSYTFNFGDGSAVVTQSGASVGHTYSTVGNFAATLTVTDSDGKSSTNTAQQQVQVNASSSSSTAMPSAALSASPSSGTDPLVVNFNAMASTTPNSGATISSYSFNFGDGSATTTQSSPTVSHTYTAAGDFTATVTVTDSTGASSVNSAQQSIQVSATTTSHPSAALSASPASGSAPLSVAFNAAASSTPNSGATVTSYTFNFGDGSSTVTQSSGTTSHVYSSAGGYTATVTVVDSTGASSINSAQQSITVSTGSQGGSEYPPLAALSAVPANGTVPLAVEFDASASSTPNAGASISRYVFNFGDGSASVTQSSATVSHSYSTAGAYTATVQVTDSDGKISNNSATATISATAATTTTTATAPDAALSVSPSSGTGPLTVAFDASASIATTSKASITRYTFTFGDGGTATQSGPTVSHSYVAAGNYTASLTVTDSDGMSSSNAAQQSIHVNSPPASVSASPSAALSASPSGGSVPLTVGFDGSASSTPNSGASITSYRFNFGDGSVVLSQPSAKTTHIYTVAGTYTATLSVMDSTGASDRSQAQVSIIAGTATPIAPTAALSASPNAGASPLTVTLYAAASTTPNAGASIASYAFAFGDGSAPVTQTSPTISHVYSTTGDYLASVTVTDSDGQTSNNSAQQAIAVGSAAGATGGGGGSGGGAIGIESLTGLALAGLVRRRTRRRARLAGEGAS